MSAMTDERLMLLCYIAIISFGYIRILLDIAIVSLGNIWILHDIHCNKTIHILSFKLFILPLTLPSPSN